MRRRMICLVVAALMIINMFPVGVAMGADDPFTATEAAAQDTNACETAQEMVDKITMGWNLGLSLSPYLSPKVDRYVSRIVCIDAQGNERRSPTDVYFHPKEGTASIHWEISHEDAGSVGTLDRFALSLHNMALSDGDTVTVGIDGFSYQMNDGKTVTPTLAENKKNVHFENGSGKVSVCEAKEGLRLTDVKEITMQIHFIGVDTAGIPAHSVEFYETFWGNPVTTQEMIDFVAARGFNIIRPQISWINHIDEDGNIDPAWMDRVAQIVDYHMNAGVYCIINTTGAGWLTTEPDRFEENRALYQKLWTQIAARFRDYGEKLIFESMNEVFYTEYIEDFPSKGSSRIINELNQLFVDTVRAQGGRNATRNLCVNTYGTMAYYDVTRDFVLPNDSAQGHLLAQVHNYTDAGFSEQWGTLKEKIRIQEIMAGIAQRFHKELNVPVIIGEFGCLNTSPEDERAEYIEYFVKAAKSRGIKLIVFDDGWNFRLLDRRNLIWEDEKMFDALFCDVEPQKGPEWYLPAAYKNDSVVFPDGYLCGVPARIAEMFSAFRSYIASLLDRFGGLFTR